MKITITGSLGHIGKELTKILVLNGHQVKVVTSSAERRKHIEALGANAAVGSVEQVDFLTETFAKSDLVYTMVPPNYFAEPDIREYYRKVGKNYVEALDRNQINRVVNLSSYGAHLNEGTGNIVGAHYVENGLNALPNTAITHIRPTYFYYNLFNLIPMIKTTGAIFANYGGENQLDMVSPIDIASAVAEEIEADPVNRKIRYVSSDKLSGNYIAKILGEAIGKPELKWHLISDEEARQGYRDIGFPEILSENLVQMFSSLHQGKLTEDYQLNKPNLLGNVKFKDFVKDFVYAYNKTEI